MAFPEIVDFVRIKEWTPKVNKKTGCYLYDFDSLGITPEQFAKVIIGRKAILFEKPFEEKVRGMLCPWCDFRATRLSRRGSTLIDHIFSHPGKTLLSYQLVKFQKEMHTLKLQLVRDGYHEAIPFFVEHSCQDCLNPTVAGRNGMCSLAVSSRSRMRSLKLLGYPIRHMKKNKKRKHEWSALGVVVLMKTEFEVPK